MWWSSNTSISVSQRVFLSLNDAIVLFSQSMSPALKSPPRMIGTSGSRLFNCSPSWLTESGPWSLGGCSMHQWVLTCLHVAQIFPRLSVRPYWVLLPPRRSCCPCMRASLPQCRSWHPYEYPPCSVPEGILQVWWRGPTWFRSGWERPGPCIHICSRGLLSFRHSLAVDYCHT